MAHFNSNNNNNKHDQQQQHEDYYSTLEFAGPRNTTNWQTSEHLHPAPQVDYHHDNLEVDQHQFSPEPSSSPHGTPYSDYKILAGTISASHNGADGPEALGDPKPKTVCGLRRRTFWIILGITAALIAIGVGIGASMGLNSSRSSSQPGTPARPPDPNNNTAAVDADPLAVAANSKLAAANLTDQYGHENHFVFYQLNSGAIRMATYNSSVGDDWVITPISDDLHVDAADIAKGTAISVSAGYWTSPAFDVHLCWTSTARKVLCYLWRPVSTIPSELPGKWGRSSLSGAYTTITGSSLATYGRYCITFCDTTPFVIWQTPAASASGINGAEGAPLQGVWHDGTEFKTIDTFHDADSIPAKQGTPMILMPVAVSENVTSLNIYFISGNNIPTTLTNLPAEGDAPDQWRRNLLGGGLVVDRPVSIAAFSTTPREDGLLDTDGDAGSKADYAMVDAQVLIAGREEGKVDPSVRLQYYDQKNGWRLAAADEESVRDLDECRELSMLAASQAARVYCLVRKKGSGSELDGVDIVQFQGGKELGKFERLGVLDVSVF